MRLLIAGLFYFKVFLIKKELLNKKSEYENSFSKFSTSPVIKTSGV